MRFILTSQTMNAVKVQYVTDKNQSSAKIKVHLVAATVGSSIYLILPTGLYSDFEEYFTFVDEALRSSNNVIYMYNH